MSEKSIALNRQAGYLYDLLEFYEAGLVLKGTEVKSLRVGQVNLKDSFARALKDELYLFNMHIAPYEQGNRYNSNPTRTRKLLLNRKEIERLISKVQEKGLTLIPTKLYFKKGIAKVEIALAKGKKVHDKRDAIKKRDIDREMRQAIKERGKGGY